MTRSIQLTDDDRLNRFADRVEAGQQDEIRPQLAESEAAYREGRTVTLEELIAILPARMRRA